MMSPQENQVNDFRADYNKKSNLKLRLADFILHVASAMLLVYVYHARWYYGAWQWMADMMLPIIWTWSYITKKYLSEKNFFLFVHKALHDRWTFVGVIFLYMLNGVFERPLARFILANWFLHLLIDAFTHEEIK